MAGSEPETGGNSLHQAIYFLRRVFEPDFREGMSAGYIQVDGEVVSLEPGAVDSASRECWRLLRQDRKPGARRRIERLLTLYRVGTRSTSRTRTGHATIARISTRRYWRPVEAADRRARRVGDFERAIRLGHAVLAIDPLADAIELELLRAYKASGRHAAAAEQYAHYAAFVRDELGADPPSFDEI